MIATNVYLINIVIIKTKILTDLPKFTMKLFHILNHWKVLCYTNYQCIRKSRLIFPNRLRRSGPLVVMYTSY